MELLIDQEFRDLIPPLSAEETANLEQSLLTEGCRDAILTWNNYIVDGHNRYRICTELNIPFRVEARQFDSRNDVCIWMIQNQFGRRNLDNYVKGSLSLRLEDYFKQKAKENISIAVTASNVKRSENPTCQNSDNMEKSKVEKVDTKKELARIAGVSHDTIYKVKEIKSLTPPEILSELESNIISHKVSINQAHKFIRLIKSFNGKVDQVTIAKRILSEFDKNQSVSLENKAKDVIREIQKEERDREIAEAEERKRLLAESLRKEREEKERLEAERLKKEREEKERAEKERLEQERVTREKARLARLEEERLAREKYEKEQAEKERIRKESQKSTMRLLCNNILYMSKTQFVL